MEFQKTSSNWGPRNQFETANIDKQVGNKTAFQITQESEDEFERSISLKGVTFSVSAIEADAKQKQSAIETYTGLDSINTKTNNVEEKKSQDQNNSQQEKKSAHCLSFDDTLARDPGDELEFLHKENEIVTLQDRPKQKKFSAEVKPYYAFSTSAEIQGDLSSYVIQQQILENFQERDVPIPVVQKCHHGQDKCMHQICKQSIKNDLNMADFMQDRPPARYEHDLLDAYRYFKTNGQYKNQSNNKTLSIEQQDQSSSRKGTTINELDSPAPVYNAKNRPSIKTLPFDKLGYIQEQEDDFQNDDQTSDIISLDEHSNRNQNGFLKERGLQNLNIKPLKQIQFASRRSSTLKPFKNQSTVTLKSDNRSPRSPQRPKINSNQKFGMSLKVLPSSSLQRQNSRQVQHKFQSSLRLSSSRSPQRADSSSIQISKTRQGHSERDQQVAQPVKDIQEMDFHTLLKKLLAPNNQYLGCHLNMTDTVFYDSSEGKLVELFSTNKDGFLTSTKKEKKLKTQAIQSAFGDIVRARRRAVGFQDDDLDRILVDTQNFSLNGQQLEQPTDLKKVEEDSKTNSFPKNNPTFHQSERSLQNQNTLSKKETHEVSRIRTDVTKMQNSVMLNQSALIKKAEISREEKLMRDKAHDLAIFRFTQSIDQVTTRRKKSKKKHANIPSGGDIVIDEITEEGDISLTSQLTLDRKPSNKFTLSQRSVTESYNPDETTNLSKLCQDPTKLSPLLRVVNGEQFSSMIEKLNSLENDGLLCIQTCIKAQKGLGKHIRIDFSVQLDLKEQIKITTALKERQSDLIGKCISIKYDFGEIGEEYRRFIKADNQSKFKIMSKPDEDLEIEKMLRLRRPKDFCFRQLLKICFYLQTLHEIEILQMSADFFVDDDGMIWLFYVEDILHRKLMKSDTELHQEQVMLDNINNRRIQQIKQKRELKKEMREMMLKTKAEIEREKREYELKYERSKMKSYKQVIHDFRYAQRETQPTKRIETTRKALDILISTQRKKNSQSAKPEDRRQGIQKIHKLQTYRLLGSKQQKEEVPKSKSRLILQAYNTINEVSQESLQNKKLVPQQSLLQNNERNYTTRTEENCNDAYGMQEFLNQSIQHTPYQQQNYNLDCPNYFPKEPNKQGITFDFVTDKNSGFISSLHGKRRTQNSGEILKRITVLKHLPRPESEEHRFIEPEELMELQNKMKTERSFNYVSLKRNSKTDSTQMQSQSLNRLSESVNQVSIQNQQPYDTTRTSRDIISTHLNGNQTYRVPQKPSTLLTRTNQKKQQLLARATPMTDRRSQTLINNNHSVASAASYSARYFQPQMMTTEQMLRHDLSLKQNKTRFENFLIYTEQKKHQIESRQLKNRAVHQNFTIYGKATNKQEQGLSYTQIAAMESHEGHFSQGTQSLPKQDNESQIVTPGTLVYPFDQQGVEPGPTIANQQINRKILRDYHQSSQQTQMLSYRQATCALKEEKSANSSDKGNQDDISDIDGAGISNSQVLLSGIALQNKNRQISLQQPSSFDADQIAGTGTHSFSKMDSQLERMQTLLPSKEGTQGNMSGKEIDTLRTQEATPSVELIQVRRNNQNASVKTLKLPLYDQKSKEMVESKTLVAKHYENGSFTTDMKNGGNVNRQGDFGTTAGPPQNFVHLESLSQIRLGNKTQALVGTRRMPQTVLGSRIHKQNGGQSDGFVGMYGFEIGSRDNQRMKKAESIGQTESFKDSNERLVERKTYKETLLGDTLQGTVKSSVHLSVNSKKSTERKTLHGKNFISH